MVTTLFRRGRPVVLLLGLLAAGSCSGVPTDPLDDPALLPGQAALQILADVSGTSVAGLVVEVTAADIPEPLVFNVPVTDGVGRGTIRIPAGSDRTITVRALNADGIETHRGSVTIDVVEGTNATVAITLFPLEGDVPIEVRIGSLMVTVDPDEALLLIGETVDLAAVVTDADGRSVDRTVTWGSTNPVVATVDDDGVVTARAVGQAEVVANAANVRASAAITVISDARKLGYVAAGGVNRVDVIALETNSVVASSGVGLTPVDVGLTPNGAFAYVANSNSSTVSVVATATTNVVATIPVQSSPFAVAVRPDGAAAYVANRVSGTVSVIETATNTVTATVSGVGSNLFDVDVTPDGAFAYVASVGSNRVSVIDTESNAIVKTVGVPTAMNLAVSPDGAWVYVSNFNGNSVSVIATESNTVIGTIPVGTSPRGLNFTPDGALAYVVNQSGRSVSVIDTATRTVRATVSVGTTPLDVATSPDGAFAYVSNWADDTVSVIATDTDTVVETIAVGANPWGMALRQ